MEIRNRQFSVQNALFIIIALLLSACAIGTPKPTPTRPLAFVTVTPTPPPTATPLPPAEDFSLYRAAMRPAFADDVNRLAERGITRYTIRAAIQPVSDKNIGAKITGTLRAEYTNTEPVLLNQIFFRLLPNTPAYGGSMRVSAVTVDGLPVRTELLANDTTLSVTLPQTLKSGETVTIALQFSATAPNTTRYGYGLLGAEDGVLALANFYPVITVFDEAGWHIEVLPPYGDATYTDVALYDVTLTAPQEMTIVTSGDVLTHTVSADSAQTVRAATGPMRDFFVAMSANFQQAQTQTDDVTVTAFYPAGYESAGKWMLDVAANALTIYQQLFGTYPYRSFDVVAVPMPAELGGVEFPGVIAMARRYYEQPSDLEEFVVAHEVAHQWWYGLVGNDQVNAPWLDEALTQYSAVLYFEQRYGAQTHQNLVDTYFWYPYNQLLATGADRPAAAAVNRYSEAAYSGVVYGKAPLFFEEVRQQLGDDRFFQGLRLYADSHRYGIAKPADLLDAFEQVSGQDLIAVYQKWIQ